MLSGVQDLKAFDWKTADKRESYDWEIGPTKFYDQRKASGMRFLDTPQFPSAPAHLCDGLWNAPSDEIDDYEWPAGPFSLKLDYCPRELLVGAPRPETLDRFSTEKNDKAKAKSKAKNNAKKNSKTNARIHPYK